jgi:phospholipase D1/2
MKEENFKANMNLQSVRSMSQWSGGLEKNESSILNAYYNLIDNSKHFILIENQFFLSKTFSDEENEDINTSNRIQNE